MLACLGPECTRRDGIEERGAKAKQQQASKISHQAYSQVLRGLSVHYPPFTFSLTSDWVIRTPARVMEFNGHLSLVETSTKSVSYSLLPLAINLMYLYSF
jgi:hypothetical protein